mgnify:CR=1 FL=1
MPSGDYETLLRELQKMTHDMVVIHKHVSSLTGSTSTSEYLTQIETQQNQLKQTLNSLYTMKYTEAKSVTNSYKNTLAIQNKVKTDIGNAQDLLNNIKADLNNANRMGEIADYELKKYYSYRDILKTVVYIALLLIAVMFLITQPWFPNMFGKAIIILILAYGLYLIIGKLLDNFRREDKYWDKYKQFTPTTLDKETGKLSLSKWEHNKNAIAKLIGRVGGTQEICKGTDANTGAGAYAALDKDLAKGMTAGTMADQNPNVGDLAN